MDVGPSVCEGIGVGLLKGVELNVGLGVSVVSTIFFFRDHRL